MKGTPRGLRALLAGASGPASIWLARIRGPAFSWLARISGLAFTLMGLLAAVFACLHLVPRAPRAMHSDALVASDQQREAEREVRESLREDRALPVFAAWPPFDRRALVQASIERLRDPKERALGIAWLAWLGAAARVEWLRDPASELDTKALALPELALPADASRYGSPVIEKRLADAVDALLAGDAEAEAELRELGSLLLEPLAKALRSDLPQLSSDEVERALTFLRRLPQVELADSGDLAADRAHYLRWWERHAIYFASNDARPAAVSALLHTRFARWLSGFVRGDLGRDRDGRSIQSEVWWRLWVTLPLAAMALICAFGCSMPVSRWLAVRRDRGQGLWMERALLLLHCAPGFWIALLLLTIFASGGPLGVLPGSWSSRELPDDFLGRVLHAGERAILPVLALALPAFAFLVRQRRAALGLALRAPFARSARMKGMSEQEVLRTHAAPHARFALWTLVGAAFPALVSGSVIVETLFDIPGLGRYALEGLLARDLPRVLALTALAGIATWMGLEIAEAGLRRADPRRRSRSPLDAASSSEGA